LRADASGEPMIVRHMLGSEWPGVIYAKVSPAGKRSDLGRDFSKLPFAGIPEVAVSDDDAYHYALVSIHPDGALGYQAFAVSIDGDRRLLDAFTIDREAEPNTLSSRLKKPLPEEPSSRLHPT
jgi:hypothetical protein